MNYLKVLLYSVILLIIAGAIWLAGFRSSVEVVHNGAAPKAIDEVVVETKNETSGKDTLESLFLLASSTECSFSFSDKDIKGEGTIFVDSGSARVDALYAAGTNTPTASYMIVDVKAAKINSWFLIDGNETGVETTLLGLRPYLIPSASSLLYLLPATAVQYTCSPWVAVDGSVFVVPKDISFEKI